MRTQENGNIFHVDRPHTTKFAYSQTSFVEYLKIVSWSSYFHLKQSSSIRQLENENHCGPWILANTQRFGVTLIWKKERSLVNSLSINLHNIIFQINSPNILCWTVWPFLWNRPTLAIIYLISSGDQVEIVERFNHSFFTTATQSTIPPKQLAIFFYFWLFFGETNYKTKKHEAESKLKKMQKHWIYIIRKLEWVYTFNLQLSYHKSLHPIY